MSEEFYHTQNSVHASLQKTTESPVRLVFFFLSEGAQSTQGNMKSKRAKQDLCFILSNSSIYLGLGATVYGINAEYGIKGPV